MVLQPPSQEANHKWILSVKVMAKHSIQRISNPNFRRDDETGLSRTVSNVEERRPKSSQTLNLGLQCLICFPVQTETPVWMKIMSQATCGEATRHARVSEGHALGIQSGDG
jgi:predicted secreted protein